MRIKIVGDDAGAFAAKVTAFGFTLVDDAPDLIVAYGGDGTFIGAERLWPGVPKLGIRRDRTCIKCAAHADEVVLDRLRRGELPEDELVKLLGTRGGDSLLAVNDITFRNSDPRSAVRFVVHLNDERVTEEMIGDGLVVCTPFGSSAYFRSITRMMIHTGIGIAFNNCTDLLNHLVIGDGERLKVEITRGPATLSADNDESCYALETGDVLHIRRADEVARIVAVATLRCTACRYVHAPRRRY